ncbi:MAG: aminopeptidase, partial [Sedimentisphaerales bacterium]
HKLRHAHMIGITPQIMKDGMCSDYGEIQRISRLVYEKVKDASKIRVVTQKGGDFTAKFSPELKWIVSDGDIQPGHWDNLPDGEVFTSPLTVNGTVVIDGCLGDFFAERYGSLENTPIIVEVKDGRAVRDSLRCDDEALKEEFGKYVFETDENSNRVGEFAIGMGQQSPRRRRHQKPHHPRRRRNHHGKWYISPLRICMSSKNQSSLNRFCRRNMSFVWMGKQEISLSRNYEYQNSTPYCSRISLSYSRVFDTPIWTPAPMV